MQVRFVAAILLLCVVGAFAIQAPAAPSTPATGGAPAKGGASDDPIHLARKSLQDAKTALQKARKEYHEAAKKDAAAVLQFNKDKNTAHASWTHLQSINNKIHNKKAQIRSQQAVVAAKQTPVDKFVRLVAHYKPKKQKWEQEIQKLRESLKNSNTMDPKVKALVQPLLERVGTIESMKADAQRVEKELLKSESEYKAALTKLRGLRNELKGLEKQRSEAAKKHEANRNVREASKASHQAAHEDKAAKFKAVAQARGIVYFKAHRVFKLLQKRLANKKDEYHRAVRHQERAQHNVSSKRHRVHRLSKHASELKGQLTVAKARYDQATKDATAAAKALNDARAAHTAARNRVNGWNSKHLAAASELKSFDVAHSSITVSPVSAGLKAGLKGAVWATDAEEASEDADDEDVTEAAAEDASAEDSKDAMEAEEDAALLEEHEEDDSDDDAEDEASAESADEEDDDAEFF